MEITRIKEKKSLHTFKDSTVFQQFKPQVTMPNILCYYVKNTKSGLATNVTSPLYYFPNNVILLMRITSALYFCCQFCLCFLRLNLMSHYNVGNRRCDENRRKCTDNNTDDHCK